MAWLPKRTRSRRVPPERVKPPSRKPLRPITPPGKGLTFTLLTVLFLAGGALVLNWPVKPAPIQTGETARRDYLARVSFKVLDEAETRRAHEAAEARVMRVFSEEDAHLDRLPVELERFLKSLNDARKPGELVVPAARHRWGLSEEKLGFLKAGLDEKWIVSFIPALRKAVQRARDFGVMESSDRKAELSAERYEIRVRNDTEGKDESGRSVALVLEYPSGLQDFLKGELQPVLQGKPEKFSDAMLDLLTHAATPTLKLDEAATDEALRSADEKVPDQERLISKKSILLAEGERATPEATAEIEAEQRAYDASAPEARDLEGEARHLRRTLLGAVGLTGLFVAGFLLLAVGGFHIAPELTSSNTRLFGIYAVSLLALGSARLFEQLGASLQWTPVLLAAMVLCVMAGPAAAIGIASFLAVLAGFVTQGGIMAAVPLAVAACVGVIIIYRLRRRSQAFEAGLFAGVTQALVVWTMWAIQQGQLADSSQSAPLPFANSLAALAGGLLAGSVLTGALPYIERAFDVATDLRLFEWTDQNQPLLRRLALEAPGTYHHSTLVSNMAEVAAEEIGANALLACAGGYLHDVGKISRPEYFVENMTGQPSPHERLAPMLSALILTAHTRDGAEVATQYGVPSSIRRIIAEHHGTCLTEFFYDKALKAAGPSSEGLSDAPFRYRGAKPHSPEAAIVMLADSAESAARSLDSASPSHIEKLVHAIVEKRLKDGQLDECHMDITDIRTVERSLIRSLMAISHPRIRYPATVE